jgi:hypothetical protein
MSELVLNHNLSASLLACPGWTWMAHAMQAEADKLIERLINADDSELDAAKLRARIRLLREWIAFPQQQHDVAASQLAESSDDK